jgi:hypothetical protein
MQRFPVLTSVGRALAAGGVSRALFEKGRDPDGAKQALRDALALGPRHPEA